ncbi:MAG: hypothetical protein HY696_00215 [Deltaproteobacteria bacterium]|nr:hypothetical protein [Deltaproteobacteria bacterium]
MKPDELEEETECPNCGHATGGQSVCANCGVVLFEEDDSEMIPDDGDDLDDEF